MQFYFDRTRRNDPHALPNGEVFRDTFTYCERCGECVGGPATHPDRCYCGYTGFETRTGYYYWTCFPGCLPESEPIGPFPNVFRAVRDARR